MTPIETTLAPTEDATATREVVRLAQQGIRPHDIHPEQDEISLQAFVLEKDQRVVQVDTERFAALPERQRGTYRLQELQSLVDSTKEFTEDPDVWVDSQSGKAIAVCNDQRGTDPGWGDLRLEFTPRHTEEWDFWMKANGALVNQAQFADHIEGGLPEIVDPDGATMLEIANSIQVSSASAFRSSQKIESGEVHFTYETDVEGTAGRAGELAIPRLITLRMSPFVGEEEVELTARFLYRVNSGTLSLGYRIERPERAVATCVKRMVNQLRDSFDRVYEGSPAVPRSDR